MNEGRMVSINWECTHNRIRPLSPEIKYILNSVAENSIATYNSPTDSSPANNVFRSFRIPSSVQFDKGMEIPNMKGDVNSSHVGPVDENAFIIPSPNTLRKTERPTVNNAFLKLNSFISCGEKYGSQCHILRPSKIALSHFLAPILRSEIM